MSLLNPRLMLIAESTSSTRLQWRMSQCVVNVMVLGVSQQALQSCPLSIKIGSEARGNTTPNSWLRLQLSGRIIDLINKTRVYVKSMDGT